MSARADTFTSFAADAAPTNARTARILRVATGIALVLHGLGHAVLPARGAGTLQETMLGRGTMNALWTVALVGFVAAGFGLLGAPPFQRAARKLTYASALASAVAIATFSPGTLAWGLVLDAAAVLVVPRQTFHRPRRVARIVLGAIAIASCAWLLVTAVTRPWRNRWGVRADEVHRALPGDLPNRDPAFETMHAITIDAPPERVWPWLAQLGQDRGGFYSYASLENLFGLHVENADRIHPEWEAHEGDLVRATPPDWLGGALGREIGWRVTLAEPNRALVLRWWGAFVLEPQPDGRTRLIVRSKTSGPDAPAWGAALGFVTFELPHFIMERKMLLTLRDRAEGR